jgi:hypothetical protein
MRGRTVMFGGLAYPNMLANGETWEWDGHYWTQMADVGPRVRASHSMVFDTERNQTVLFGGNSPEGTNNDTWAWDGVNWTQLADSGPTVRTRQAMAYDSSRSRTVLFGGLAFGELRNTALADTWEWDGSNWTQLEINGPGARFDAAMAYDSVRGRAVLFGGADDAGVALGDTWEWDGSLWSRIAGFGSAPASAGAAAFKKDCVAFFGGVLTNASPSPNLWTWDGRHWTLRQHIGPGPRFDHAMAYDSKRGCLVLFGGTPDLNRANILGDTWEHSETN